MENRFQFMIITVKKLYCTFLPLGEQGVVSTCPCGTLAQNPSVVMVKLKFSESFKNNIQTVVDCSCSGIRWIGLAVGLGVAAFCLTFRFYFKTKVR